MDEMLTLTHATERDVDLILVEELKCSRLFVDWLAARVAGQVGSAISHHRSQVLHSKRRLHNRREIDITLALEGDQGRTILLLENKLDTAEQPRQAESYREEAVVLVEHGRADAAFTVLVCPRAYAVGASSFAQQFDAQVSYEAIAEHLDSRADAAGGELALRAAHRAGLLRQAITKARRGYEAVPVDLVESFNARYVTLVPQLGVDLEPGPSMLKPGRPGESKTMIFAPAVLPKWEFLPQTRLVHQLREGNANINLYGWGDHFSHVVGAMAPALAGTPYRLVPTVNKRVGGRCGLMIVVDTPSVDNLLGFDEQVAAIAEGIRRTADLRAWFIAQGSVMRAWAALVAQAAGETGSSAKT